LKEQNLLNNKIVYLKEKHKMITLKKITADNWKECINLRLSDDEKDFIHPNVYSIAEAQFYPKAISRALYADEKMVGYVMFGEDEDNSNLYYIDRLMISYAHRKQGFASNTLQLIIEEAKNKGFNLISTSIDLVNHKMSKLLIKNGFYTNNELDEDEIIYHYEVKETIKSIL